MRTSSQDRGPAHDTAEPAVAALEFHDVDVVFGEAVVLEKVSFTLDDGCFLAVVGPNGAGKSTLIKVALGLVTPSRGTASLLGRTPGAVPEGIGYVPQLKTFDRTFPATTLELVVSGSRRRWPARITRSEHEMARAALQGVGALHLDRRPLAKLSGGELQRVFLARALVRRPRIVLLDEPATGVDFLAEHDLYELLESFQRQSGATIVMVTHDLAVARFHADRVLVLNRRVHGYGAPDQVLDDEGLRVAFGHVGHGHALRS